MKHVPMRPQRIKNLKSAGFGPKLADLRFFAGVGPARWPEPHTGDRRRRRGA